MSAISTTGSATNESGSTGARFLRQTLAALGQRLFGRASAKAPTASSRKAQADALREWAWTAARNDRGFQDDLFAAADRHERAA